MDQIRMTTTEAALYITIFNTILGIVLGLIPLILGFVKKERSYALFGFLGSAIGGAILGLFLSLPIAIVFVWLILKKPKNKTVDVRAVNENPVDVKVEKF